MQVLAFQTISIEQFIFYLVHWFLTVFTVIRFLGHDLVFLTHDDMDINLI